VCQTIYGLLPSHPLLLFFFLFSSSPQSSTSYSLPFSSLFSPWLPLPLLFLLSRGSSAWPTDLFPPLRLDTDSTFFAFRISPRPSSPWPRPPGSHYRLDDLSPTPRRLLLGWLTVSPDTSPGKYSSNSSIVNIVVIFCYCCQRSQVATVTTFHGRISEHWVKPPVNSCNSDSRFFIASQCGFRVIWSDVVVLTRRRLCTSSEFGTAYILRIDIIASNGVESTPSLLIQKSWLNDSWLSDGRSVKIVLSFPL